jgi:hypothetical protein
MASTERAGHPSGLSDRLTSAACRPGGSARTLMPQRDHWVRAMLMVSKGQASRPCVAGDLLRCESGTAALHPIHSRWFFWRHRFETLRRDAARERSATCVRAGWPLGQICPSPHYGSPTRGIENVHLNYPLNHSGATVGGRERRNRTLYNSGSAIEEACGERARADRLEISMRLALTISIDLYQMR